MKFGYVIFRKAVNTQGVHEVYVVNPAMFALIESEHIEEASYFDSAREAYERAGVCGLWEWRVGLR